MGLCMDMCALTLFVFLGGMGSLTTTLTNSTINPTVPDSKSTDQRNKRKKPNIGRIQRLYYGYVKLHTKWPQQIPVMNPSPQLRSILARSAEVHGGPVWDPCLESISVAEVDTFTVPKLKTIIRFFKVRKVQKGLNLCGQKDELQAKVRNLLQKYSHII
jgi:hypothetical protein